MLHVAVSARTLILLLINLLYHFEFALAYRDDNVIFERGSLYVPRRVTATKTIVVPSDAICRSLEAGVSLQILPMSLPVIRLEYGMCCTYSLRRQDRHLGSPIIRKAYGKNPLQANG
jgi:hypothetical protein